MSVSYGVAYAEMREGFVCWPIQVGSMAGARQSPVEELLPSPSRGGEWGAGGTDEGRWTEEREEEREEREEERGKGGGMAGGASHVPQRSSSLEIGSVFCMYTEKCRWYLSPKEVSTYRNSMATTDGGQRRCVVS
jgi:hypothetical protein